MPRETRRYYVPSKDETVTKGKLKRLTHDRQLEVMRRWFSDRYDTPDELPYNSSEGGYQWIWGGPHDAEDELRNEFSGAIPDVVIEELASELNDITWEWSGKPSDEDFHDDYIADLIDSGTDPFLTLLSSLIDIESAADISATETERKTLHKLLFANVITALETFLGDLFMKTLSRSHKYMEDFVFKTPHFQQTDIKLSRIFEHFRKIDAEVRAYVLAHNWHMMKESSMMYKRAFNLKFPEIPDTIANGIRDRHNIVHRDGKTTDGAVGVWGLPEITALKAAALKFAGAIDTQAKNLSLPASQLIPDGPENPDDPIQI
jgi:hypothetical protein